VTAGARGERLNRIKQSTSNMKNNYIHSTALALACLLTLSATNALATVFSYSAVLNGPSESPANASPGTGTALVDYDNVAHTLYLNVSFSGLLGTTTASHIHAATALPLTGTAGVATTTPTFAGFPTGVTSGSYINTLDLTLSSSYNPTYLSANGGSTLSSEIALLTAISGGKAYFNIHSSAFGGGEIRGFLVPVPEPSGAALMALGVGAMAWAARRRKTS
jgi:hypothetical protein